MRGIQGQYSLKDELDAPARHAARHQGQGPEFNDGPQSFSQHYVEPRTASRRRFHLHLEEYAPGRPHAEARPRQRGRLLHPRRRGLRDPRRRALRLEGGRRRDRAQQLRAPALQREPDKPARALVIKTKPMFMFMNMLFQQRSSRGPTEPRARRAKATCARDPRRDFNHEEIGARWPGTNRRPGGRGRSNQKLYQALLEDAAAAPARNASARRCVHPGGHALGAVARRGCSSTC